MQGDVLVQLRGLLRIVGGDVRDRLLRRRHPLRPRLLAARRVWPQLGAPAAVPALVVPLPRHDRLLEHRLVPRARAAAPHVHEHAVGQPLPRHRSLPRHRPHAAAPLGAGVRDAVHPPDHPHLRPSRKLLRAPDGDAGRARGVAADEGAAAAQHRPHARPLGLAPRPAALVQLDGYPRPVVLHHGADEPQRRALHGRRAA
mmetsp:Transcript_28617/g.70461  ORF Transcript_28617/g.70461 Transcript_28617/m.70461 type:complete len:200 (-) Transcript_28617:595-1194(-)